MHRYGLAGNRRMILTRDATRQVQGVGRGPQHCNSASAVQALALEEEEFPPATAFHLSALELFITGTGMHQSYPAAPRDEGTTGRLAPLLCLVAHCTPHYGLKNAPTAPRRWVTGRQSLLTGSGSLQYIAPYPMTPRRPRHFCVATRHWLGQVIYRN